MEKEPNQLDFDFSADRLLEFPVNKAETGWFDFKSERDEAIQMLEKRFHIALNRRVRLRLKGWPEEFEGKLMLEDLLTPTGREKSVRLRVNRLTFDNTDIEYCQTLD